MGEAEWLDNFGDNLSILLADYRVTQAELAEMTGLSEPTISSYINKRRMPGVKAILNIAYALNIDIEDLVDFGSMIQ